MIDSVLLFPMALQCDQQDIPIDHGMRNISQITTLCFANHKIKAFSEGLSVLSNDVECYLQLQSLTPWRMDG